jgi:hypothetical protein
MAIEHLHIFLPPKMCCESALIYIVEAALPISDELKGHGNEADFLEFLYKPVRHRSLTLHFEPFRFWLRIRGDIRNRKKNDSPTRRIVESTKLPIDTIFFKPLNKSMVVVPVHNIPGFFFAKLIF